MFKASVGPDTSPVILANLSTMGKTNESPTMYVFVDFQFNPLLQVVNGLGQIYGLNPETHTPQVWENTSDLTNHLRKLRPKTFEANGLKQEIMGLNKIVYDRLTNSAFIKTNTLGMEQQNKSMVYTNYIAYMLHYKAIKFGGGVYNGTPKLGKTFKPNNFNQKEFDLFRTGYVPLCVLDHFENQEISDTILELINHTPLMEGMLLDPAYNILGRLVPDMETIWVTKRSVAKFLDAVRPGILNMLSYTEISLKLTLLTLFEYAGLMKESDYTTEYNTTPLPYPPVTEVTFGIHPDELGINRMYVANQAQA